MKDIRLYMIAAVLLFVLSGVVMFNSFENMGSAEEKKPPTDIEFIHWAYFPDELFDRFSLEHPDIKVNYERYNSEDYEKLIRMRIRAEEKTDVMGVPNLDYADFAAKGYLVNLEGRPFLDSFKQEVRNAVKEKFHGGEFAVAYRSVYYGIWYNKTLFDKYGLGKPRTFAQLLQVCAALKSNGINPIVLGARDDEAALYFYLVRLFDSLDEANWKYNVASGIRTFDSAQNAAKFAQMQLLVDNGFIDPKSGDLTFLQAFDHFKKGSAAMIIAPDWSISMTEDDMEKVFEPDVFSIPYTDVEIDAKAPMNRADCLIGVYSGSENIEQSMAFLEFLSRPEIAQLYCDKTVSYPTVKGVDTQSLPYSNLWEPIRKMEGANADYLEIDKQKRVLLARSTKLFLAGEIRANDLITVFQEAYGK